MAKTAPELDRFHTVQDVADRLRLSAKTVRRLIEAGKLRAYQIERQWRVGERDLLQFLNARRND